MGGANLDLADFAEGDFDVGGGVALADLEDDGGGLDLGQAGPVILATGGRDDDYLVLFGFADDLDHTLNDYLWGKLPIKDTAHDVTSVIAQNTTVAPGGALFLVPSSMKAGDIARVLREGYDVGTLNDGFRDLAKDLQLDYLLIDTHPGLNEETLLSITISDVLLLILRPDRQDFQGTAVTVDVARRLDVPALFLVVNKVPSGVDMADLESQMEAAYKAETAAILPLSEQVVQNASGGLFSLTSPDAQWSQGIRKIAARVSQ